MPDNKLYFEDGKQVIDGDQLILMSLKELEWLWTQDSAAQIGLAPLPKRWRVSDDRVEFVARLPFGRAYVFDRSSDTIATSTKFLGLTIGKRQLPFTGTSLRFQVQPFFGPKQTGLRSLEYLLPEVDLVTLNTGRETPVWAGRWIIDDEGVEFVSAELEAIAAALKNLGIEMEKPVILPAEYKASG